MVRWHRYRQLSAAVGAAFLLLAAVFLLWQAGLPEHPPPPEKVPVFDAETLDGHPLFIHPQLNRPLVITFWATWCIPCQREMPLLNAAYHRYQEQGLIVVGVNAGFEESRSAVEEWVVTYNLSFPVVIDTFQEIQTAYNVRGYPTTFFVDAYGNIQTVLTGGFYQDDLEQALSTIELKD